jgi:UDP-N-acetyl-D-glucosamine dehydrogenase
MKKQEMLRCGLGPAIGRRKPKVIKCKSDCGVKTSDQDRPAVEVAIIGLGYVGLPLALQFARSGWRALGLDIDSAKIEKLNRGQSYINHIPARAVAAQIKGGLFRACTDFSRVREVEAVIICVPTPLNKNRAPDISYILDTGRAIAPHLKRGHLVVLESTTYPGHNRR